MGEHIVDITIIGGGPTGLAAAYYGAHRDASVRIVESLEQLGGQVAAVYPEKHIFDVAGFPRINGQALINQLIEQAMQYDPEVRLGTVIDRIHHRDDDVIELHTSGGEQLLTRTMIITAGHGAFNPRKLGLPERSEEHTSELQSHLNLVCRLLLEKKKNQNKIPVNYKHKKQKTTKKK